MEKDYYRVARLHQKEEKKGKKREKKKEKRKKKKKNKKKEKRKRKKRRIEKREEKREQAQAGNSMRHLRDLRTGVTDTQTDGTTDPLIEMQ